MGKTRSRHSRHSRHYRKKHDTKRRVGRPRHKSRQRRRKYRKRSRRNKKGGMMKSLKKFIAPAAASASAPAAASASAPAPAPHPVFDEDIMERLNTLFRTRPGYANALINKYDKHKEFKQDVVAQINASNTFTMHLTTDNIMIEQYIYYIERLVHKGKKAANCLPEGWIWKKGDSTDLVEIVKTADNPRHHTYEPRKKSYPPVEFDTLAK